MQLKQCPCGKTPTKLDITETLYGKWIDIMGNCCGEWTIEARNGYSKGDDMMKNAITAWNNVPRWNDN